MAWQACAGEDGVLKPLVQKLGTALLILALAAPAICSLPADPDLWWHLRVGIDLLSGGVFPYHDIYSFTFAGQPWVHHEWLSSVIFGQVFLLGGMAGLWIFHAILVSIFVSLFFSLLKQLSKSAGPALFLFLIAMPFISRYLILRSQIFSLLFVLILLLTLHREQHKGRSTLTFVIAVLWANLHGGFILGLFLCATHLLNSGNKPRKERLSLPVIFAAGTLVNRYGWRIYQYLVSELTASHRFISEWQPFLTQTYPVLALIFFLIFLILPLMLLALFGKLPQNHWVIFWIFSACAALAHRRFFGFYVLSSSLLSAAAWAPIFRTSGKLERLTSVLSVIVVVALVPFRIHTAASHIQKDGARPGETLVRYPQRAAAYLKKNPSGEKLFTPLQWGGYALYQLSPQYKVSIDGRNLMLYDDAYVSNYLANYQRGRWENSLRGLKPDCFLIEKNSPLFVTLAKSGNWKIAYIDELAVVLTRAQRLSSL